MPGKVVDPPLLLKLRHDGVDEREPRPSVPPLFQEHGIVVPWYLPGNRVVYHAVEVGAGVTVEVVVLAPEELAVEAHGWLAALTSFTLVRLVGLSELVVE